MPTYKLQNNGTDCGHIIVTGTDTPSWTYQAKGSNGPPVAITPTPVYTPMSGTNNSATNPGVGDTLSLGTWKGDSTAPFPGAATYAAAESGPNGKKAGYYRSASPTGEPGDWDARDTGSGK